MRESIFTEVVHAGKENFKKMGCHSFPIDFSSTYPINQTSEAIESLHKLCDGDEEIKNPVYQRLFNPTVAHFEKGIARLEKAEAAVAFSSGMAAITATLLASSQGKNHVIAIRPLYGGTDHLLGSGLLGLKVSWAEAENFHQFINPETGLIIIETPANPTLRLTDIEKIVAKAGRVPVLVDSTFATPVLQNPLVLGASYSLHSATKFIGGHGDALGGIVACSEELARKLRQIRIITGATMHPMAAYLFARGLSTLAIRIKAAQDTASRIALKLHSHPEISQVYYPGTSEVSQRKVLKKQMSGPGTMLSFELKDGFAKASSVMESLKLITPAVSLGSTETLIQHPASLTHALVDKAEKDRLGINESLLRISLGLEDPEDLWSDLNQALKKKPELKAFNQKKRSA